MEAKQIREELEIPDVNENDLSEAEIKRAVLEHHERHLVDEISKSKKTVYEYMKGKSLHNCPMSFRIICELEEDIIGNVKDMYRKKGGEEGLLCEDCDNKVIQTQSHCLECPNWQEMRRGGGVTS